MKDSIAYWVSVAETAAEDIAFWQDSVSHAQGMGYPADEDELNEAKAAHKEAMENIMRISLPKPGFQKSLQELVDHMEKVGPIWDDDLEKFVYTAPVSETRDTE